VPADLGAMLKRAAVFSQPSRTKPGPVTIAHDRDALRLAASWDGDSCSEWIASESAAEGVLTVDIRLLQPIAALAAAGVPIVAQWTPDADDPIAFALPTGARYIVQPLKMTRKPAAVVVDLESEAA
jgi:hypothetical protein